ncbi:SoxY-related AACIE arm protein [Pararhodobacter zhoushanensis]|uniref:SoxY-related AACIE arm protein n=1 Tax=Pararhodobacter zhoushanensis TaxID=2479545 RepID=A0ABT3H4B6_9RHOB|nr:SoxY-related AACIE arm protein [Pararhodobacter zhoushanensis]MCW1934607.1 SoxY-related AACIE arm protein [Pararhodobacter zhoushanensis]
MTLTRRTTLATLLGGPLVLRFGPARATPETMQTAIDGFTGGAEITEGRVTLRIPLLVENGNSVPLTVSVDSPMTPEDHVEQIAIFNEINPLPDTARFHLTPRSGLAMVETRIRLNGSQTVHAVARLSDGSFWSAATEVIVTAPACREV